MHIHGVSSKTHGEESMRSITYKLCASIQASPGQPRRAQLLTVAQRPAGWARNCTF